MLFVGDVEINKMQYSHPSTSNVATISAMAKGMKVKFLRNIKGKST